MTKHKHIGPAARRAVDHYQEFVDSVDLYKEVRSEDLNPEFFQMLLAIIGINDEAGELMGKAKKIIRDKGGVPLASDITDIVHEMGDCLWYIVKLCNAVGVDLDFVIMSNMAKLKSRQRRDKLRGSGDDR